MFNWKLICVPNKEAITLDLRRSKDIMCSGYEVIPASVPGNFELDLLRAEKIEDPFFGTNVFDCQKLENRHIFYFSEFEVDNVDSFLKFEGIDTIADIYINGILVRSVENMFLEYDVEGPLVNGINDVVVHIKPVCIESRKYKLPAGISTQPYNFQGIQIRKALHSFGWDITPRIVSAGIWRDVKLERKKKDKINNAYLTVTRLNASNGWVDMTFFIDTDIHEDYVTDYSVKMTAVCGEHQFGFKKTMWHNCWNYQFNESNCKLWWPKNYGEQNLYDVRVELYFKEELCDTVSWKAGLRTVGLDKSDITNAEGDGEFCFKVNNTKIFCLGTNWVPLDAFHSRDAERLDKALEMLDDIGCNTVRCWGGNVYEDHAFFDFCDRKGILIWQDFSMSCTMYSNDERFIKLMKEEADFIIKKFRNHPSLLLWAGDNECDDTYRWSSYLRDPNQNLITRQVIKKSVFENDYTRPYLPSSPYVSEKAFRGGSLPEDHLWGPRDYFKSDFYRNSVCHFASETGYHGFPSLGSLKRFLNDPETLFKDGGDPTDEYLAHAACMEIGSGVPFSFRIRLAYDQVKVLFEKPEENFIDFIKQSQISQAEAKKFFIERFRIGKWRRTGIIWWNLVDCWPQISDAIVDYYYVKKLAYSYIKRSQYPICFMFDEPKDGKIALYGVNDRVYDTETSYKVLDVYNNNKIVLEGTSVLKASSSCKTAEIPITEESKFYLIEWADNDRIHQNHYCTNLIGINYKQYLSAIEKCKFDQFEGMN